MSTCHDCGAETGYMSDWLRWVHHDTGSIFCTTPAAPSEATENVPFGGGTGGAAAAALALNQDSFGVKQRAAGQ